MRPSRQGFGSWLGRGSEPADIETNSSFINPLSARTPSDGTRTSGLSLRPRRPGNEETAHDHELPRHKCWSRPFPSGWCPAQDSNLRTTRQLPGRHVELGVTKWEPNRVFDQGGRAKSLVGPSQTLDFLIRRFTVQVPGDRPFARPSAVERGCPRQGHRAFKPKQRA